MSSNVRERKPGRPRAIPEKLVPHVISLYRQRFGYRAIRRELRKEGISVSWSTVRRLVKEKLDENLNYRLEFCRNRFKVKQNENLHHKLEYCQGVAEVKQHENRLHKLHFCDRMTKGGPNRNFRHINIQRCNRVLTPGNSAHEIVICPVNRQHRAPGYRTHGTKDVT